MSSTRTAEAETHRRDAARYWRVAFVVYAVGLTVGTHWPRLKLAPQVPATDKTIHLLAFGGLAFLLWRTGWIRRRWSLAAIVIAWAVLDEISQGIPILHRHVSGQDALASGLGVVVMTVWLWALKAVGGPSNRRRLALDASVFDRLFARGRTWLVLIGLLLACVVPIALVWSFLGPDMMERIILIAGAVGVAAAVIIPVRLLREERATVMRERPCFECGAASGTLRFDASGTAACPVCHATLTVGQWMDPPSPDLVGRLRLAVRPVIAAGAVIVLVFGLLLASAHVYTRLIASPVTQTAAARTARFVGTLPPSLTTAVDLALALLLLAIATRSYRGGLARFHDRAFRCAACSHDLRGTPTEAGLGRCGECGTEFGRIEGDAG